MITPAIAKQIDGLFRQYTRPGSPGCALAVMKDGKTIYQQGYGLANVEHQIPNTPATIFNIGSEAKQFTALAILMLADEGKLSLDDDIRQHLRESPDFGHIITVRHLLHHTSGLRCSFPSLLILSGFREGDITTTADVMRLFRAQRELNFLPGEEHSYANMGYVLLAQIVERISGKSFAAFCQERIFQPLEMTNTCIHDNHAEVVPGSAQSYFIDDSGKAKVSPLADSVVGPTNVYTTVEDLAKWDENFYTGTVGGKRVIDQMHQLGTLNNGQRIDYACGLTIGQHRGLKTVDHGGGQGGYCSHLIRFADQHFSVVVIFNTFTWMAKHMALQVAGLFLADTFQSEETIPASRTDNPIPVPETQLEGKAGKYFHKGRVAVREVMMKGRKLQAFGMDLIPTGEGRFILSDEPDVTIEFHPAQSETPTRMRIVSPTSDFTYERVEEAKLTPKLLETYAGSYFSPEVQVLWTLEAKEGDLLVHRQKYADTSLTPLFADAFHDDWSALLDWPGFGFTVLFSRDDQGTVTGFSLSDDRMRNLKFTKQEM